MGKNNKMKMIVFVILLFSIIGLVIYYNHYKSNSITGVHILIPGVLITDKMIDDDRRYMISFESSDPNFLDIDIEGVEFSLAIDKSNPRAADVLYDAIVLNQEYDAMTVDGEFSIKELKEKNCLDKNNNIILEKLFLEDDLVKELKIIEIQYNK